MIGNTEQIIRKEKNNDEMNLEKLGQYWERYKEYFKLPANEHQEKYKWTVLRQVYDKWNWDVEDKPSMFKNCFEVVGSKNLWMSGNFYPIPHTNWMFENFKDETISQFNNLFNEEISLNNRVNSFIKFYDEKLPLLQNLVPDKKINYHSHGDLRAIAIYLSLQFPQKYFLYKYTMVKNFCDQMDIERIKAGNKNNLDNYQIIANEVLDFILKDESFLEDYRKFTNLEENYKDQSLHLLVQDFVYTISQHFNDDIKYWRIGTKDDDASYWNLMKNESKVCIGWGNIGNLESIENKNQVINLLTERGYYPSDNRNKSRKAGEIFDFVSNVKIGDIILAQDGHSVLGIGIVKDDYFYNDKDNFSHQKDVEWIKFNPNFNNSEGNLTTVYEIRDKKTIKIINDFISKNKNTKMATIFEKYEEYLNFSSVTQYTINTYVEKSRLLIPAKWKEVYSSDFDAYSINIENLRKIIKLTAENYNNKFTGKHSFYRFINELIQKFENKPYAKNLILYGAPGTGKTFDTKRIAVEIIDGKKQRTREDILKEYNSFVDKEQINFVTFHQSMSYEDFIEGIKPKLSTTVNGEIEYEVKSGIFKKICESAKAKEKTNFKEVYNKFIKDFSESDEEFLVLHTPKEKEYSLKINGNNNLTLFTTVNKNQYGTLTSERLEDFYLGFPTFSGWEGYATGFIKYLEKEYNLSKEDKIPNQKYVLIIDEINRGNVSAIFGELITLIEDDKRKGLLSEVKETIEVKLPYSNEPFSVPDNLYIIGTMNTADRSVEALDTALRRRFSFIEVSSNPEILQIEHPNSGILNENGEEIDLIELLKKINQRIELLIDKDHQIGHSYFIKVNDFSELKTTFKDKIIPLLEEYFYGDFGKIGLVLGSSFIKAKYKDSTETKGILATFKDYEETDFIADKKVFELNSVDELNPSDFISIYNESILND